MRGGGGDFADCGPGDADRAVVDAGDVTVGCEIVEPPRPAARDGPPADPGPPAAPPAIGARLSFAFAVFADGPPPGRCASATSPRAARVHALHGRWLPGVARRTAACRPRARRSSSSSWPRAAAEAGAVLEVRITAAGCVGKVTRFLMRRARVPVKTSLCLAPGDVAPRRCA